MIIEDTYQTIQMRAKHQMRHGDITGYLRSLIQLQQMRNKLSLINTAKV